VALLRKTTTDELPAGSQIDRYRVEEMIGRGGMGAVYRAVCEDSGDTVALKVIKGDLAGDSESLKRFTHEARAASEVKHRHVVPLLDYGDWEGRRYLVMNYIQGQSLEQRIDSDGPQPIGDVVRMASQIGSALDAIHAAGIIHRDIKVSNILFDH